MTSASKWDADSMGPSNGLGGWLNMPSPMVKGFEFGLMGPFFFWLKPPFEISFVQFRAKT